MTKKIILDCDPGHDDAVAILLAAGNPEIELIGVTTVGGNQTLQKVTYNARQVMTVAGITDVPPARWRDAAAGQGGRGSREHSRRDRHGDQGLHAAGADRSGRRGPRRGLHH
nr:nucleoside hydrolase [Corynebacterium atypicum]